MRQREHQSGFGTVKIVLMAFGITVLAVTGLVLYQHHKPSSANNSAATSTTQTTTQPQNTTTTQPAAATTQYLTIKEWGVKMPLSGSIKTAYYKAAKGSSYGPGGLPSTVWLGLASNSNASCNPSNNDNGQRGALGAILRVLPTDTDQVSGQLLTQKYPNGATVGGYYYAYQSWANNNPCASKNALQPTDSAFVTAAKGIVAAN